MSHLGAISTTQNNLFVVVVVLYRTVCAQQVKQTEIVQSASVGVCVSSSVGIGVLDN